MPDDNGSSARTAVGPRRPAGRSSRSGLDPGGRSTVRAFASLVAAGFALAAAGCAGGDDETASGNGGRVPPKLVRTTAVAGGTAKERKLVRGVMAGMEQTTLRRVRLGRGAGKAVAIRFTPVSGETARRKWDEWIVAGALSRRLLAAGSPAVVAGSDGGTAFKARPRVPGNPDPRPLSPKRERAIVKAVRRAVRRSGADLVSLEAHRPYGVALALSLSTDDPARFLAEELLAVLSSLDPYRRQLEGFYLAVLEDRREFVLEWGSWTRNPAGTFWVRPDLADCSPIRQSAPTGTEPPPPCPAT